MRDSRAALKGAEVASGLGAAVLGMGLGLLAPAALRAHALPVLVAGLLVHGAGMTLKHRIEARGADLRPWERAVFWSCWVLLAALAVWLPWSCLR